MKHKYKVDIRWSDEDEVYVARVPELDGVVTHGSTVVEAAKMAEAAIKLHLESLKKHNQPIPTPSALKQLNGQYPLRMGKDRHQDAYVEAEKLGMSFNEYVVSLIDQEMDTKGLHEYLKMQKVFKGHTVLYAKPSTKKPSTKKRA